MEDRVKSAVREFAKSEVAGRNDAALVEELISLTSEIPLSNFDNWERLIRSEYYYFRWESIPPKWKVWIKPSQLSLWLDLFSWDGYKREKALETISAPAPNAFFFSLAVRRLNDWVPQVREAARKSLPNIAKLTDPNYVTEALTIALPNWNSWGRIEKEDKKILLQIIHEDKIAERFRLKLISSMSGPMTSLFTQLGRTSILDEKIEDIARLAAQPSLRAKAYRSLFEKRITWIDGREWIWTDIRYCEGRLRPIVSERKLNIDTSSIELIRQSARDSSSIVRRVSADYLIRDLDSLGEEAKELAQRFSSDKSNAVSERGNFAIKKLGRLKLTTNS